MLEPNEAKQITLRGRLSFPTLTAEAAYERSKSGQYPVDSPEKASPDFQLLLDQAQLDKFLKHATEVFLPWLAEREAAGEKKDALTKKEVQALEKTVTGDLEMQSLNTPLKAIHEKTAAKAPDAVAAIKCVGFKGSNIKVFAVVQSESELTVPDADIIDFPVLKPIEQTTHELYAGCDAVATINLYSYRNGRNPGFSAGASAVVFRADNDPFGGAGADVDMDAVFMD